jgi:hypothetical protein
MPENRPIGFIGQNTYFFDKKEELNPFSAVVDVKPQITVSPKSIPFNSKTDSVVLSSVLFKGNGIPVNIFAEKGKVAGKTVEIPGYQIDDQGNTNSCGTTSLTSVLKYFGSDVKDHWEIDKKIRSTRFDMFTAPGDIVSFAESKGFRAGLKNNATFEDLASFVDKGIPAIILIDPSSEYNFNMHWMVVKGYERNEKGEIDNFKIADPSGGWSYNQSAAELKKQWGNIRVGFEKFPVTGDKKSFSTGYNNLMITMVPKNKIIKTPDGKPIDTNLVVIPGKADTIHGYGAQIVARSALILDKTITLGQSMGKAVSGKVSSLAKKMGL